ncbi:MAG: hypothetical protein Q9183_002229 [Haloplaca sp. 2 TL-2023]
MDFNEKTDSSPSKSSHFQPNDYSAKQKLADDKENHKITCKAVRALQDRQILYRAGELAKDLWMLYCRQTWQSIIEDVREIEYGEIEWSDLGIVYAGKYWEVYRSDRGKKTQDFFLPFPVGKFPNVQQQEALLTQSQCRRVRYVAPEIVKIREMELRIKNQDLMLVHTQADKGWETPPARHRVLKITLPNKDSYALDFTAPQYGWHGSAVMPWTTIEKERLGSVLQDRDVGWTMTECLDEAYAGGLKDRGFATTCLHLQKCFHSGLAAWQQQNTSFQELLACSEEGFWNKKNDLLTFMERGACPKKLLGSTTRSGCIWREVSSIRSKGIDIVIGD